MGTPWVESTIMKLITWVKTQVRAIRLGFFYGHMAYIRYSYTPVKFATKYLKSTKWDCANSEEQIAVRNWEAATAAKTAAIREEMAAAGVDYDEFIAEMNKND